MNSEPLSPDSEPAPPAAAPAESAAEDALTPEEEAAKQRANDELTQLFESLPEPLALFQPATFATFCERVAAVERTDSYGDVLLPLYILSAQLVREFWRAAPPDLVAMVAELTDLSPQVLQYMQEHHSAEETMRSLYAYDASLHGLLSLGYALVDAPYMNPLYRRLEALDLPPSAENDPGLVGKALWDRLRKHLRTIGRGLVHNMEGADGTFVNMTLALAHGADPAATPAPPLRTSADLQVRRRKLDKLLSHSTHALARAFDPVLARKAEKAARAEAPLNVAELQEMATEDATNWAALRAADPTALPDADLLRGLHAHFTLVATVGTYLLRTLPRTDALLRGIRAHAPLTRSVLHSLSEARTGAAFVALVERHARDLYHALVVTHLALTSPLRPLIRAGVCQQTAGFPERSFELLAVGAETFAALLLPTAAEWTVDLRRPIAAEPAAEPAATAEQQAALAALAEHRRALAELFATTPLTAPPPEPALPRHGPFLRYAPTDLQLPLLRLLTLHVPTLSQLIDHPFAAGLDELSGFQPRARVDDFYARLLLHRVGQPLQLSVEESVMVYQLLQGGALLLLRGTGAWLTKVLRRRLHAESLTDPELEAAYARLLFLLSSESTFERFRETFRPLLTWFTNAVQRLYPHHPLMQTARREIADLTATLLG